MGDRWGWVSWCTGEREEEDIQGRLRLPAHLRSAAPDHWNANKQSEQANINTTHWPVMTRPKTDWGTVGCPRFGQEEETLISELFGCSLPPPPPPSLGL
ncbi:hypothetical protein AAFF_G00180950 [Aldrovandia affinis]|uniref:Uncharacterized protein n=1 Tax=Aldrovandia affinis TaxID=143900 RepID=A0AAD7WW03_9TELE|nr:hypothetical protein AAFF_G00180950 [Aldrovandia affinis]